MFLVSKALLLLCYLLYQRVYALQLLHTASLVGQINNYYTS